MELSLFDFDFKEENENLITEDKINEQFKILQGIFKNRNNAYYLSFSNVPNNMMIYIDYFEEKGWIERRNNGINILDQYLEFHTVEEIVEKYKSKLNKVLNKPNICWYKNILPIVNNRLGPIRYRDEETKKMMSKQTDKITKKVVTDLGLKHFLEVPSARGTKMNSLSSKWAIDNVLPVIFEMIKPITDFDEMKNFFYNHVFFIGRRDWDRTHYSKDYKIPPYPEYKRLMPYYLEIASLCEAEDLETVKLILEYAGSSSGYTEKDRITERNGNFNYIYPEGWSHKRYVDSLTSEDLDLINQDKKRLNRLHSNNL